MATLPHFFQFCTHQLILSGLASIYPCCILHGVKACPVLPGQHAVIPASAPAWAQTQASAHGLLAGLLLQPPRELFGSPNILQLLLLSLLQHPRQQVEKQWWKAGELQLGRSTGPIPGPGLARIWGQGGVIGVQGPDQWEPHTIQPSQLSPTPCHPGGGSGAVCSGREWRQATISIIQAPPQQHVAPATSQEPRVICGLPLCEVLGTWLEPCTTGGLPHHGLWLLQGPIT